MSVKIAANIKAFLVRGDPRGGTYATQPK